MYYIEMENVKLKNSLAIHNFVFGLIKKLALKIKEIENFTNLKMNPELTKYICQCVEQELSKVAKKLKTKIDKTKIVTEVLTQVFGLSDTEVLQIESQVDFLFDNKLITIPNIFSSSLNAVSNMLGNIQSDPSATISSVSTNSSNVITPPTNTST